MQMQLREHRRMCEMSLEADLSCLISRPVVVLLRVMTLNSPRRPPRSAQVSVVQCDAWADDGVSY